MIAATLFALAPSPVLAAVQPDATAKFPSASSTVIASTGFVNGKEIGYFWSKARGDSVTQTISGPNKIGSVVLRIDVVHNELNTGYQVNWRLMINGHGIRNFVVHPGVPGSIHVNASFPPIHGPSYTVEIKVTNEVANGGGSITLAYRGAFDHSITLKSP